jgi:CO/xanthine dehydrogenase FAD-binding subunit
MLVCDEYLIPASLDEALAAMAERRGRYRLVAGATDTYPWAREGRAGDVAVPALIDVSRIPELTERRVDERGVRLGAATPIQRFLDDAALVRAMPCMPRCAVWFADDQIRAQATIGGNIVNASPAADVVTALLALDADLTLAGTAGERRVALHDFLLGPGRTDRRPDEVLTSIGFARLPAASATAFLKAGRRKAMEISVVCVAARLTLSADRRTCETVRLALGAVGPRVLRARAAETFLAGGITSLERFRDAGRVAAEGASPISDVRASARYRRHLVEVMIERALSRCVKAVREGTA